MIQLTGKNSKALYNVDEDSIIAYAKAEYREALGSATEVIIEGREQHLLVSESVEEIAALIKSAANAALAQRKG